MTKKQEKFKVYVDDNFHYMDAEERYADGEYDTYEEAEARCKEIVERSIMEFYKPGITIRKLYQGYFFYGEDPFVRPSPEGKHFSARTYASMRIDEIIKSARTNNMIYTEKIRQAIKFAIKTHEIYQQQKRKGGIRGVEIPYITHPLSLGIILARSGASEDVIVAGILHDTIEDSIEEKKVTREMIDERFGPTVAELVASVTEFDKKKSWDDRKSEALEHIQHFSNDSVLIKSADILSNGWEMLAAHKRTGDEAFAVFKGGKEKTLTRLHSAITALTDRWPESPLTEDLADLADNLNEI